MTVDEIIQYVVVVFFSSGLISTVIGLIFNKACLLYTSPSPRDTR